MRTGCSRPPCGTAVDGAGDAALHICSLLHLRRVPHPLDPPPHPSTPRRAEAKHKGVGLELASGCWALSIQFPEDKFSEVGGGGRLLLNNSASAGGAGEGVRHPPPRTPPPPTPLPSPPRVHPPPQGGNRHLAHEQ